MSTRATYSFSAKTGTVTYYIHHDGYPEGAAEYFGDAMTASGVVTAENFEDVNKRAELTEGHEVHGDTQYRYYVSADGKVVTAYVRDVREEWAVTYRGFLTDFVKEHGYISEAM